MREERQKLILELILTQPVETQQQLMELLRQRGFHCTQATLSRDIRALHLYKIQRAGRRAPLCGQCTGCCQRGQRQADEHRPSGHPFF